MRKRLAESKEEDFEDWDSIKGHNYKESLVIISPKK